MDVPKLENELIRSEKNEIPRVSDICQESGVTFVHGISERTPGNNSILNPRISWRDKFDILVSLKPAISASSVGKGDDYKYLWSFEKWHHGAIKSRFHTLAMR